MKNVGFDYDGTEADTGKSWEIYYSNNGEAWARKIQLTGSGQWLTERIELYPATFPGRTQGNDFRIQAYEGPISFHEITVYNGLFPTEPETGAAEVIFNRPIEYNRMDIWYGDSGSGKITTIDGVDGMEIGGDGEARYLYCNVDDGYMNGGKNKIRITIEYYDGSDASIGFAYNAVNTPWRYENSTQLKNTGTWKTLEYVYDDALMANGWLGAV